MILLCVALVLLSSPVVSAQVPLLESSLEGAWTSDGYARQGLQLTYTSDRRDPLWPYSDEPPTGLDLQARVRLANGKTNLTEFYGIRPSLGVGWKFSDKLYTSGQIGYHRLARSHTGDVTTTIPFQLYSYLQLLAGWQMSVELNRDLTYQDLAPIGGIDHLLAATTLTARAFGSLGPHWRSLLTASQSWLTDSNLRQRYDLSLMRRLGAEPSWIWLGVGSEWIFWRENRTVYWSPTHFVALGPRFEAAVPIIAPNTAFVSGVSLHAIRENLGSWGLGYYSSLGVQVGSRESQLLRIDLSQGRSVQNATEYLENAVRFSGQMNF